MMLIKRYLSLKNLASSILMSEKRIGELISLEYKDYMDALNIVIKGLTD